MHQTQFYKSKVQEMSNDSKRPTAATGSPALKTADGVALPLT